MKLLVAHALCTEAGSPSNSKVELVKYDDYMGALRTGAGPFWEILTGADLVMGGASLDEWM